MNEMRTVGPQFLCGWTTTNKMACYIKDLGWNRLGLRPSKMQSVLVDQEMWWLTLELQRTQPSLKSG